MKSLLIIGAGSFSPEVEELTHLLGYSDIAFLDDNPVGACSSPFNTPGFIVIGCDTHFDTRVDDVIVSKTSLHGLLILNHGKKEEIEATVEQKHRVYVCKKMMRDCIIFHLAQFFVIIVQLIIKHT